MIPADKAAYPDQFALQEIMAVWRKRVDPQGVRGVKLRSEGSNAIVVELPASANLVATKATSTSPCRTSSRPPRAYRRASVRRSSTLRASRSPSDRGRRSHLALRRPPRQRLRRIEIIEGNANPADVFVAGAEVKLEAWTRGAR